MSNDTLQMTMLFDFFGDLLTEKQREYFDLYHNEDLSLSEIAVQTGISRQGVHDNINRAENALLELEEKTGVVRRWTETRIGLEQAEFLAQKLLTLSEHNPQAKQAAQKLVKTLQALADN